MKDRVQPTRPRLERGAFLPVVAVSVIDAGCSGSAIYMVEHLRNTFDRDTGFGHAGRARPPQVVATKREVQQL